MKSEHRHDLQTNDLSKLLVQAEPFLEKYGRKIAVAVGAVLVISIGYSIWSSIQSSKETEAWTRLAAATATADFENVADEFPGTEVADWAWIHAAESHLQSGIRSSFTDRKAGVRELDQAKEQFQNLLETSSTLPPVRERALFGMARVEEATSNGDLTKSIELYKKLIKEYPDSVFRKLAEARVKPVDGEKVAVLDKADTQGFYKWFHAQNPKPGDRPGPGFNMPLPGMSPPGNGGSTQNETPVLPNLPPLNLPGLPEPLTSSPESDEKKTPESKPESKPATPEKEEPKSAKKPAAPEATEKKSEPSTDKPKSEPATEKKP